MTKVLPVLSKVRLVAARDNGAPFNSMVVEPEDAPNFSVDVGLVTLMFPVRVAEIFASPPDCPRKRAVLILTLAPSVTVWFSAVSRDMLVAALIETLFPAPGSRLPVPTNDRVVVGEPLMLMLVVGPVIVDCTVPLLVKVPPLTLNVIV